MNTRTLQSCTHAHQSEASLRCIRCCCGSNLACLSGIYCIATIRLDLLNHCPHYSSNCVACFQYNNLTEPHAYTCAVLLHNHSSVISRNAILVHSTYIYSSHPVIIYTGSTAYDFSQQQEHFCSVQLFLPKTLPTI